MKKKQKDDILGEQQSDLPINEGSRTELKRHRLLMRTVPGGCPNEKCESKRAYFYQLQTRSADEPPTSFYKVRSMASNGLLLTAKSVLRAPNNGESTELGHQCSEDLALGYSASTWQTSK